MDVTRLAETGLNNDEIKKLIDDHKNEKAALLAKYDRYKASRSLPIFGRSLEQNENAGKINNTLNNDFAGEIIDTKIGYFIGNPISYMVSDGKTPDEVEEFNRRNDIEDTDAETCKLTSICGYSARLMYLDPEGVERVRRVYPWEVVFFYDESMTQPTAALRYFDVVRPDGVKITKAQLYTETNIIFYETGSDQGGFREVDRKVHRFGKCPLWGIPNNDELQGDFDKVVELIDAYDRALSDQNSEIEQMRLAYMYVRGLSIGEDPEDEIKFINQLRKTGLLEVDGEGDVGFITKNLNTEFVEKHLDRLEKRIQQGAKNVNFADDVFGGNLSGQALKYKLFNLETKCRYSELKFKKALRYQYTLLGNSWKGRGKAVDFDPSLLEFKFTRNVFIDYKNEAEILEKLMGRISDETALSLMSFIKDARAEMEKKAEEDEEKRALVGQQINLDEPGTEEGGEGNNESDGNEV